MFKYYREQVTVSSTGVMLAYIILWIYINQATVNIFKKRAKLKTISKTNTFLQNVN